MVMGVYLHELAHSSLVWYGRSCDSPKLSGIKSEAGNYYKKAIFGGITSCEPEINSTTLQITQVGVYKGLGTLFYPIGEL